jgi:hypothetical protein
MSYALGNILGRFIASYLLVLVFNFLVTRFKWRDALRRSHSVWGWVSVVVVFGVGIVGHIV